MSKAPKTKKVEDATDTSLDTEFDALVTSEGNTAAELKDSIPTFMSDDPNEVVKAIQAAMPKAEPSQAPEEPKVSAPTIVKVSEKTLAEMNRGREIIAKYV